MFTLEKKICQTHSPEYDEVNRREKRGWKQGIWPWSRGCALKTSAGLVHWHAACIGCAGSSVNHVAILATYPPHLFPEADDDDDRSIRDSKVLTKYLLLLTSLPRLRYPPQSSIRCADASKTRRHQNYHPLHTKSGTATTFVIRVEFAFASCRAHLRAPKDSVKSGCWPPRTNDACSSSSDDCHHCLRSGSERTTRSK